MDNKTPAAQLDTVIARRRAPRYDCEGRVEIARIPSIGIRKGRLGNLSVTGCFIEIDNPFSAGTYVEVTLQLETTSVRIAGSVKNIRKTGMGIAFHCVSDRTVRLLQSVVQELERSSKPTDWYP